MARSLVSIFVAASLALGAPSLAAAGPREQAERIHDRLAGVPPSAAKLDAMTQDIQNGDASAAAFKAMEDPHFYTVTLKNFAAPWTNRDQSPFVPLNDYTTLVMGMVRDDVRFDEILYGDILYVGKGISPAPAADSNAHYEALEQAMLSPSFDPQTDLTQTTQSSVYGLPSDATAGAITTRAASEAFFIAGTNRAMFRFTLINHMCTDLEQVHDVTIVPDRIRQDVSRSPGGDSRVFLNSCIGCHAGMDPMAQAFAYYNFDETSGRLVYTPGVVQEKYFHNELTFPDGFRTPDDSWDNYWRQGQNASLGWDPNLPGSGQGAKSLGQELASTQAFAQCQAKKVFKAVCLRNPVDAADRDQVAAMATSFKNNNYKMKNVFADAAVYCMGN
ncbi:MAG TPA: hypothetical protein VFV10_10765 [Gammaproteobacteria bacterium]|nr:hypothetical protein [Gammaproteobacteria bacterium]